MSINISVIKQTYYDKSVSRWLVINSKAVMITQKQFIEIIAAATLELKTDFKMPANAKEYQLYS